MCVSKVRSRFTLIELLVVISIIGILASLLLPSLARARAVSKAAVCVSNLKQLGMGIAMYSDGSSERTPPSYIKYPDNTHPTWAEHIAVYLGKDMDAMRNTQSRAEQGAFNCPENDVQTVAGNATWSIQRCSYGGNAVYGFIIGETFNGNRALGIKLSEMRQPSDLYLLTDSVYFRFTNNTGGAHMTCKTGPSCVGTGAEHGPPRYAHLSKLNMLFSDMHVNAMKYLQPTSNRENWYANPE